VQKKSRRDVSPLLIPLPPVKMLLPASLALLSAAGALAATPDVSPLAPNQAKHYLTSLSFRGLNEGRVNNYDLAGHGAALPGVHDFLRLVPVRFLLFYEA
jgi:hypothetical protein